MDTGSASPRVVSPSAGPIVYLHLLGFAALAIARPLFEVLAGEPEFFDARGSERADVLLLMVLALLVAPLPWLLAALAARRLLAPLAAARAVAALVGSLAALIALRAMALAAATPAAALLTGAGVGGAVGWLYLRLPAVRQAATWLTAAAVAVPALFVLDPGVANLLEPPPPPPSAHTSGARTPVVFLVLDELPLTSLLDEAGDVDARLYPHIAGLAREATWFRNAAASSRSTVTALPALLSGVVALKRDAGQREHNLFTLLGDYPTYASESINPLCPRARNRLAMQRAPELGERARRLATDLPVVWVELVAPPAWRRYLPPLSAGWDQFATAHVARRQAGAQDIMWRRERWERLLDSIAPADRALYFVHTGFPHGPWEYLPSGRRFPCSPDCYFGVLEKEHWRIAQLYQRYLLQLGHVDGMVGELIARLRRAGLYERALIVVVADHGTAFRPGLFGRDVVPSTLPEIVNVPLLIKRPNQHERVVVDELRSTSDILATIADVLDVRPPWPVAGRSLFAGGRTAPTYVSGKRRMSPVPADLAAQRADARQWLATLTAGSGGDPWRIGPVPGLLGSPPGPDGEADGLELALDDAGRYGDVDPLASVVPVLVRGKLLGGSRGDGCCTLAVAMNGTVWATTTSYWAKNGDRRFAALVPEGALRRGANEVAVYAVEADGSRQRLVRRRSRRAAPTPGRRRRGAERRASLAATAAPLPPGTASP